MSTLDGHVFRVATLGDMERILEIIEGARASLRAHGIPQWTQAYPTRDDISADIVSGQSRVLLDDTGRIVATTYLAYEAEPNYSNLIEGAWKIDTNRYAVLHRVAVDVELRGQGVSGKLFTACINEVKSRGYNEIRVDTHETNLAMRKALEKAGFTHQGTLLLPDGAPRVVYEWCD